MKSAETLLNEVSKHRGPGDNFAHNSYGVLITSTNSHSEKVKYNGPRGGRLAPITHPYLGPNSWIRIMPEVLTSAMVGIRAENGEAFIQSYLQESDSDNTSAELPTVVATQNEQFYYRTLEEGEIDITSKGIASTFYSKNGTLEMRGGVNSAKFDADRMEIKFRSPTHQKAILGHKRQDVGNEERFGVVRRPNSLSDRLVTLDTLQDIIKVQPPTIAGLAGGLTEFAKEYLRIIKARNGETLVDHREGNVIDDDGTEMESDTTGNKLRSITKYGTKFSQETSFEVDEEGNIVLNLPITATKGGIVNIGQGPALGGNLEVSISLDMLINVGKTIVMDALQEIELTGPQFNANTLLVSLVKGADTPAVRGTELSTWLSTHTHQTLVGPTSPPVQAPTLPIILSQFLTIR